ncbi:MAG: hypothetical protein A7315_12110 [Candidatus Altiarchaeales archaeon WOR_SM1_79]|nr:MAG: hypothetical protein A7315_12110 [Candidatus Altiarchaeales archaeon WOR_SM1_79]
MVAFSWDKTTIKTDNGEEKEGIAPVIISASRSTDIPAWHAKWFINRLNKGYVKWINPFNQQPQYVSFDKTRAVVFWSKNPEPLIPYLDEVKERGINYYFQFTVNDYEDEKLEPNVPSLEERIATFKELSNRIGKEKVIWRFDPLILTDNITVEKLLEKIYRVGCEIHDYTEKLVISFADIGIYTKVQRNLKKAGIGYREFREESMKKIAEGIQEINKEWGLEVSTCAEKVDLSKYNIEHNKCIDDDLMVKIFNKDKELMEFLGAEPVNNLMGEKKYVLKKGKNLKDKGQRLACGCIVSKDIGQYNTCRHLCVYCYANYSKNTVESNMRRYDKNYESILRD